MGEPTPATNEQMARIKWFLHLFFGYSPFRWVDSIREVATAHIWGETLCVRPEKDWPHV